MGESSMLACVAFNDAKAYLDSIHQLSRLVHTLRDVLRQLTRVVVVLVDDFEAAQDRVHKIVRFQVLHGGYVVRDRTMWMPLRYKMKMLCVRYGIWG